MKENKRVVIEKLLLNTLFHPLVGSKNFVEVNRIQDMLVSQKGLESLVFDLCIWRII